MAGSSTIGGWDSRIVWTVSATASTRTGISIPVSANGLLALGRAGSAKMRSWLKFTLTGVSAVMSPERVTLRFAALVLVDSRETP